MRKEKATCIVIFLMLFSGIVTLSSADQEPEKLNPAHNELPSPFSSISNPDSLKVDSLALQDQDSLGLEQPDSLNLLNSDSLGLSELDSTAIDSLIADSLAQIEAERVYIPFVSDTIAPPPPIPGTFSYKSDDKSYFGYKDSGDLISIAPILFPRQTSFLMQPYNLIPPGQSGRDLLVQFRGRPWNDPVTGGANMAQFAAGELNRFDLSAAWSAGSLMGNGPVLSLYQPHDYLIIPRTEMIYRQGFYGIGVVDWRIAQKITPGFRYHFGMEVGEYAGRRVSSAAHDNIIRLGGRQILPDLSSLDLNWIQTRISHENAYQYNGLNTHRNDLDIAWEKGSIDTNHVEVAFWYLRSKRDYPGGNEDGARTGIRSEYDRLVFAKWLANLRMDYERIDARFQRLPLLADPRGKRDIAGLTTSLKGEIGSSFLALAFRQEIGTLGPIDSNEWTGRTGGSATIDHPVTDRLSMNGQASLGWRWPSMDEAYGKWVKFRPERYLDANPIDQAIYEYAGNDNLLPVGGLYTGSGITWRPSPGEAIQVNAGLSHLIDPIEFTTISLDTVLTTVQSENNSGFEISAAWRLNVWGPFSTEGSYTFSSLSESGDAMPDVWGRASLRAMKYFFNGDLKLHGSLTARYYGQYSHSSDWDQQGSTVMIDGLINARISKFELYWGANNWFSEHYAMQVGYPSMHRDEVFGVRWFFLN